MIQKHWAPTNIYEELIRFVVKNLEESDLKYHPMKRNAIYLSVAIFNELQSAIAKHIEKGTTVKLSLVNKLTLGTYESTSISYRSELSIFITNQNAIINKFCDRSLCLVLLESSKSAGALHEEIIHAFDGTNMRSASMGLFHKYIRFESPFSKYINCRDYPLALEFVHLKEKYRIFGELDSLFLHQRKVFHKKQIYFIENSANPKTLKILKVTLTLRLSHENLTERVIQIRWLLRRDIWKRRIQKSGMSGMHCCDII